MKLLVTAPQGVIRESFLPKQVRDRLESVAEVEYNTLSRNWTPEELRDRLHGVDVALTGWGTTLFDETVLAGADRLRLIAHTGGSVTPVMSDAAYDRGIRVISGNEMYAESVAESVIAYALTALRKIPDYLERTRNGGWYENGEVWEGLLDQTVGIIGFGMTSRHLFRMGKAFRMKFKVLEKPYLTEEVQKEYGFEVASLEEIFRTCKIVSLHCGMTKSYYHLVDERLLGMMPDGALLINTARGPVIDEKALIAELKRGRIRAVLDVYEEEPLPADSELRRLPNAYCVPHMGGPTFDRRWMITMALIDDILRMEQGEPMKLEITRSYASHMSDRAST